MQSLVTRQQAISELWSAIDKKLKEKSDLKVSFMQKNFYDNFKLLVEKEKITVDEWEKISRIELLNTQPFYDVTYITDGTIYVDIDRLISLKPEDMYEWFYEWPIWPEQIGNLNQDRYKTLNKQ